MKKRIFVDMDGTLTEWNNVEKEDVLYEQGYYENLKPNEILLQEIKNLIYQGEDIYILSSFLNESKYALQEKQNWLKKYLPELSDDKKIFVKYGDNKTAYIPNKIGLNDYLIDDYTKNLLEWKEAGGTGIKFLNGINHTKKTWDGFMLKNNEKLTENLELILSYPEGYTKNFNSKYMQLYSDFLTAIEEYKSSINNPLHDLLNAEVTMKDAKMDLFKEHEKLLEYFNIEVKERWSDEGDTAVHYQISLKNGKVIYEGYTFIDIPIEEINQDIIINNVLNTDITNKKDIIEVSHELKSFVKDILSMDHEGSIRLYGDDLLNSWDMDSSSLASKMKEVEREIDNLGINSSVEVYYNNMGYINYIDVNSSIIDAFDFTKEYHPTREKRYLIMK